MVHVLETAKYWHGLGVATIPIVWKSKQPRVKWLPYTERMPTMNELEYWFRDDDSNIGIVTGWQGLCIVDFDDMDVFMKWYWWAMRSGGKARDAATQARLHQSARGMHLFIQCEKAVNMKLPKIDILANRKYALLPPSVHPTGLTYKVYRNGLPLPVRALEDVLPKRLLDQAVQKTLKQTVQAAPSPAPAVDVDPWKLAGIDPSQRPDVVDRIKAEIPITSILSGSIQKSTNGWLMTQCPFHDDKSPSMWISPSKGLCGCLAGCTPLPLDVIDLYARLNGMSNEDAIRELAKKLH